MKQEYNYTGLTDPGGSPGRSDGGHAADHAAAGDVFPDPAAVQLIQSRREAPQGKTIVGDEYP